MSFKTADLYDDHADELKIVEPMFRSFGGRAAFHGPVSTIKTHEDNSRVHEAVAEPGEGRVLVVDGGGSLRCALLGDMLGAKAVENGWSGVIVWGCVRDVVELGQLDLGCLALASNPAKSVKAGAGMRDVPVSLGALTVAPGQFVYADEDGVVVCARDLLA
jgi:regulator of ribonuclease activity A